MLEDLKTVFKYKKECYQEDGDQLSSVFTGDRARRNELKLQQGKFWLDTRKNFLSMSVVKDQNRLSRGAVESLTLSKCSLDKHLSGLV